MATPPELVHRDDERGVVTLTLDSPANRNALSAQLIGELSDHLDRIADDPTTRAVVLAHTGTTFCAGADLAEVARQGGLSAGTRRIVDLLRQILELPRPVVACIDGNVRAGGIGLVGACDLAVVGPDTSFALTEVRLALAPAVISLTVLPRLSDRAAARWFLTGDRFDAAEAERIGLVNVVADDPSAEVARLVESFRACAPQGLAETKALLVAPLLESFDARAADLVATSARLFASPDAQEGIGAFRERRPPRWAADT
ncbi:MAG: enoyl-CoA hydratase family protein [Actinobacteria bacterium]|nr:enoyl-CoA hydratase family protein [Actinomycetota bacterium]